MRGLSNLCVGTWEALIPVCKNMIVRIDSENLVNLTSQLWTSCLNILLKPARNGEESAKVQPPASMVQILPMPSR